MTSSISQRINVATRQQHTDLNRRLIQRLPLALPPFQSSPRLFGKGILPFARIFILFEVEWDLLTQRLHKLDPEDESHDAQMRRWLAGLRPAGLARSERVKNDLQHLRIVAGANMYSTPSLGDAWVKDMRIRIRERPEVLVAFAWIFYMATFSGGRWIREQLANGGVEFWTGHKDIESPVERQGQSTLFDLPGFSFLSFPGDHDGEDLKMSFKARLAQAEDLLTDKQKQEIIDVSQEIFDKCLGLVTDLDRMVLRSRILSWTTPILYALSLLLLFLAMRYGGHLPRYSL